jgi:hypothetical protein
MVLQFVGTPLRVTVVLPDVTLVVFVPTSVVMVVVVLPCVIA